MKINRLQVLIGCTVLATALIALALFYVFRSTPQEKQPQVPDDQTSQSASTRKPSRRGKASGRRAGSRSAEGASFSRSVFTNKVDGVDEITLTAAQQALLDELQEAADDESLRRVAKIVEKIQDQYRKGGDAAVPPSMREQAVEALSWFLPDSLAELIGFMADSNPEVLEDVMKNFTEGIDDAELGDRELANIFKKIAPLIEDDDAIDAILMGLENDMRNSVAVDTYKEIFKTGSDAIKQRLAESMQDFTGEDDITTPEQLDAWLKENPDDEDDEEFYGNANKDGPDEDKDDN